MGLNQLRQWLETVDKNLNDKQKIIAQELLKEIKIRLDFILDVGLGYLSLNRSSKSLSGGEAQRIRLATQIGTELINVCYIFDEPSIGLHQRDNKKLIGTLKKLRDLGNSVIVVEHDEEMMVEADYIIDIGRGAGINGGNVVAKGKPLEIGKNKKSLTGQYLSKKSRLSQKQCRRVCILA